MLGTAVIVFRETLEAALIVTIVLAATRGLARRGAWIGGGVALGVAGAIGVAAIADVITQGFAGMGQELFNAAVLTAAVVMLSWHHLWMTQHGRALAGELRALGDSVRSGGKTIVALFAAVALAVLREGSETVLFLAGLATAAPAREIVTGFLVGAAGGVATGFLLYRGLVRIPMRHFFRVTGWMIVALTAGLAAQAARFLEQADLLPPLRAPVWDSSALLSEGSIPGQLLHVLIGYTAQPSAMQLIVYAATLAFLIGAAWLINRPRYIAPRTQSRAA